MKIIITGVQSMLIGFALWFAISYFHTHAILNHPIRDGYASVEDLLLITFLTGLMIGAMNM